MVTALPPPDLPGDYNDDNIVDAADFTVWQDTLGSTTELAAAGDASGTIDAGDYDVWKTHFGERAGSSSTPAGSATPSPAVPEPTSALLAAIVTLGIACRRRHCAKA